MSPPKRKTRLLLCLSGSRIRLSLTEIPNGSLEPRPSMR
jgi:hypothetical protein